MNPGSDTDTILSALTLEQKAGLLSGLDAWRTKPVEEARVPAVWLSDGPHGVRREVRPFVAAPSTCFPNASALACSWDRAVMARVGGALGAEARAMGVGVLLGPGVNIKRTPLCGRNFEYFSEDPLLTGELAASYVQGVQSQGIGTALKHYAANNQEWGRQWFSSDVDERPLREIYLAPFEHVVTRAKPWSIMCSYNRVNGVHASQHRELLTDVLRTGWGFDGVVMSDWGAVHDRVASLAAGLDLEMPGVGGTTDAEIVAAVRGGRLDEATVDRSARRVLELVARSIPAPTAPGTAATEGAEDPSLPQDMIAAHHALATEMAAAAVTLLRNEGVLPLSAPRRLAVIGPLAANPRIQGAGSAHVLPTTSPSAALEGLQRTFDVTFAAGFAMSTSSRDERREEEALAAIRAAEVTLVFVGQLDGTESEGHDRADLELPANQLIVLEEALNSGTPVVVVVNSGSVLRLGDWHDRSAAIVYCPFLGQGGGDALVRVLTGALEPSGRLTETWPLRLEDTPAYANYPGERGHTRYGEGVLVGYRWFDELGLNVRYPFGHGLSYTSFEYGEAVARLGEGSADVVSVTCTLTNTGPRAGAEVVQVYVAAPERDAGVPIVDGQPGKQITWTPVRRPVRELRDFSKVHLSPGESTRLEFRLEARAFSYWDVEGGLWRRDPGTYRIELGSSSRDLRAATEIDLPGHPPNRPEATDDDMRDAVFSRSAVTP